MPLSEFLVPGNRACPVILDQTKQFQLLAVGWDENLFDNYKNFLAGKTVSLFKSFDFIREKNI
jgi:hypothetical protein